MSPSSSVQVSQERLRGLPPSSSLVTFSNGVGDFICFISINPRLFQMIPITHIIYPGVPKEGRRSPSGITEHMYTFASGCCCTS